MATFTFREGFIQGVHTYLWRDSQTEFIYVYGGIYMEGVIHIRSLYVPMERLIKLVHIYLWSYSYVGRDSYKEFIWIYVGIHN